MTKRKLSISEVGTQLNETINLLQRACKDYDDGYDLVGRTIATQLRVLLHNGGSSHSVLSLMHKETGDARYDLSRMEFLDTCAGLIPENHPEHAATSSWFVDMQLTIDVPPRKRYIAPLAARNASATRAPFPAWWDIKPVLVFETTNRFTRAELVVRMVANKDGGAHIDGELPEAYYRLTREDPMGIDMKFERDGVVVAEAALENNLAFEAVRQIAHEVLVTLHKALPDHCPEKYKPPSSEERTAARTAENGGEERANSPFSPMIDAYIAANPDKFKGTAIWRPDFDT